MNHNFVASPTLIIIGAGGHATSLANVALSIGINIKYFIDPNKAGKFLLDIAIIGDLDRLTNINEYSFAIAIGDNSSRELVHNNLIRAYGDLNFPPLIHPSSAISTHTEIGKGTVIMPNAAVGPNTKIGTFCIVNTNSSIDHDCTMGNYSSIAPGSMTGGGVSIGTRSAISIGASVKHGISIGSDTIIGGGSYLERDIGNNLVAYGIPAKPIKSRSHNTPYL